MLHWQCHHATGLEASVLILGDVTLSQGQGRDRLGVDLSDLLLGAYLDRQDGRLDALEAGRFPGPDQGHLMPIIDPSARDLAATHEKEIC